MSINGFFQRTGPDYKLNSLSDKGVCMSIDVDEVKKIARLACLDVKD